VRRRHFTENKEIDTREEGMAEMLKLISRPGVLGLFLSLMVVAMLIIPAEVLAASSPGTVFHQDLQPTARSPYLGAQTANIGWSYIAGEDVRSSPAVGDNSTIYIGSWVYWLWYFPAIGSDGAIDIGSDDGQPHAFSTVKAPITVVSPRGGESYTVGKWQAINWTCTVNPGYYVKIELLKDGAFYQTITARTPVGSGGSGSFVWIIPSTQTTGDDYRVKVTSTSNTTCTGASENDFSIMGPPITINSPGGGEGWAIRSQQAITWSYTGFPGPYVKIDLLKNGIYHRTIIPETPIGSSGSGFYLWAIPSYEMLGDNYQVRVTSTADASCAVTSENNFVITNALSEE
jgi:hypothetical protein